MRALETLALAGVSCFRRQSPVASGRRPVDSRRASRPKADNEEDTVAKPTKEALALAYQAGRAMQTEPSERHGIEACPFEEGDPQREEWLNGYKSILGEMPSTADIEVALASHAATADKIAQEVNDA